MPKHDTPLLDQLESGPWPSFVKDIKRQAEKNEACWDILGQLELSYVDKITHVWLIAWTPELAAGS